METITRICPEVVEIVERPRSGYQMTIKLNFAKIPRKKGKNYATIGRFVAVKILESPVL